MQIDTTKPHDRSAALAGSASSPDRSRASVSLIVPVYNSEASLPRLHDEIVACASTSLYDFEIVYVDDASTDNSLAVLRKIASSAANIVVIEQPRNRGQAKAALTGIFAASSQTIVTLDDDLQHQPADIARLLAALEASGASTLVMGTADSIKRPFWRGWLAIGANAASNLFLDKPLPLQLTTFCAFRKPLCACFDPESEQEIPLVTALVQAATATKTIPVRLNPSVRGPSRYGFGSLIRLFLSRTRYYRRSRVLAWAAVAVLLTITSAATLLLPGGPGQPLAIALLAPSAAISFMLALLAVKIDRQSAAPDRLRANRAA